MTRLFKIVYIYLSQPCSWIKSWGTESVARGCVKKGLVEFLKDLSVYVLWRRLLSQSEELLERRLLNDHGFLFCLCLLCCFCLDSNFPIDWYLCLWRRRRSRSQLSNAKGLGWAKRTHSLDLVNCFLDEVVVLLVWIRHQCISLFLIR
jgi:hypothetical protein